jgi:hypothetical protein
MKTDPKEKIISHGGNFREVFSSLKESKMNRIKLKLNSSSSKI